MTILFDKSANEYDPNPLFDEPGYAQPLGVELFGPFIVLTQWDVTDNSRQFILVERRDKQALIEALQRA